MEWVEQPGGLLPEASCPPHPREVVPSREVIIVLMVRGSSSSSSQAEPSKPAILRETGGRRIVDGRTEEKRRQWSRMGHSLRVGLRMGVSRIIISLSGQPIKHILFPSPVLVEENDDQG